MSDEPRGLYDREAQQAEEANTYGALMASHDIFIIKLKW